MSFPRPFTKNPGSLRLRHCPGQGANLRNLRNLRQVLPLPLPLPLPLRSRPGVDGRPGNSERQRQSGRDLRVMERPVAERHHVPDVRSQTELPPDSHASPERGGQGEHR